MGGLRVRGVRVLDERDGRARGTEEYEYDRHNRMVVAGLKTGVRFQYEYEANTGRCKKTWGPKGLYAIELTVDKAARTTFVDGEESRVITWNDQGLATREALPDGTVLVERAYDDDGFLVAKVNGAGRVSSTGTTSEESDPGC